MPIFCLLCLHSCDSCDSWFPSSGRTVMEKISVAQARKAEAVGKHVLAQGWVRTRRDSKGGFSFLELNDGSSFGNLQVVAPGALPNYQSEVQRPGGCQR